MKFIRRLKFWSRNEALLKIKPRRKP